MTSDWQVRVRELFLAASKRPPEERERFLKEACGDDDELRQELESLLIASDRESTRTVDASPATAPSATDDPLVGTTLDRYRILHLLGRGGMGAVYEAEDPELRRKVALKVLPGEFDQDPERLGRFQREARAVAALNHPNIVTIHSVRETEHVDASGERRPIHFLTMELVQGEPLSRAIPEGGLAAQELLDRAIQLAEGVRAAHEAGIIHRDLKPANVIVDTEGRLRILDFGLAKAERLTDDSQLETSLALTTHGAVLGTAPYMAPEQVAGRACDHRSDIFSLGSILYEMATGSRPFAGASFTQVMSAILQDEPSPIGQVRSDLPVPLVETIGRCLAKDPAERFQSALELRDALGDIRQASTAAVESAEPRSAASRRRLWAGLGAAALALALVAVVWLGKGADTTDELRGRPPVAVETAPTSIAVLPFADMSENRDQEYFSDGLAEELLNVLAKIEGLKVAARTSSFSFKGKDVDIATIAEKLNVASVLEGSVRKSGNRVRITAQLVSAADGFHLWSDTFDRELDDIFAIQGEIARSVVESLEVTLLGDAADLPQARQENTEAYEAYLQGRYFLKRGSGEDLEKALGYFSEAVALDSGYALAWAWLASAHSIQATLGYVPLGEGIEKARETVQRALTLDNAEPQAWVSLAYIGMQHDWDWVGAEEAFRRALELNPESSEALRGLGRLATKLGRFDEAIELVRRSLERDPLDAGGYRVLGDQFWMAGRLEEAEATLKKALELRPDNGTARSHLGLVYLAQSKPEAALEEMEQVSRPAQRLYGLALAYHALDRQEEAEAALAQFVEGQLSGAQAFQWSYGIASVYAFRGEPDRAFEWLERAYAERASDLTWLKVDPTFQNLHDDPRWPVFLEKMDLAG